MVRDGYFLPTIKSTIISRVWLEKVLNEEERCPKFEDIKLSYCNRLPMI